MIRLKDIIIESSRNRGINTNETINLLKTHCKESWKLYQYNNVLWRGLGESSGDMYYVDPKSKMRASKHTNNIYVSMIDTLPSWNGYPKRSFSLINTTSYSAAKTYGDVYVVFYYDGAKIAHTEEFTDLWNSFSYLKQRMGETSLDDYLLELQILLTKARGLDHRIPSMGIRTYYTPNNIEEFFSGLTYLDFNIFKKLKDRMGDGGRRISQDMIDHYDAENGWKNYFNDLFSPKNNKIGLTNLNDIPYNKKIECWSDSEAVLVRGPEISQISDKMRD